MNKILVEVTPLAQFSTGIQRYIYNIISRFPTKDGRVHYVSFKQMYNGLFSNNNLEIIKLPKIGKRTIFSLLGRYLLCLDGIKVYWSTYLSYPVGLEKKIKVLSTVYDLIPFKREILRSNLVGGKVQRWLMRNTIVHSSKIVTISEYVANEIISKFDVSKDKIKVVYPASDFNHINISNEKKEEIRKKYNLKEPFVLSLCSLSPRKNLKTVIDAFSKIKNKRIILVLAGKVLMDDGTIAKSKEVLGERVRYLGYVPYEDLAALYSAANTFIAPSLEEGFDMPSVEALSCGTKVIASDIPVHHEVLENDVEYFSPEDAHELALLIDKFSLLKESINSEIPLKFSWDKSSKQIYDLLCEMAGE